MAETGYLEFLGPNFREDVTMLKNVVDVYGPKIIELNAQLKSMENGTWTKNLADLNARLSENSKITSESIKINKELETVRLKIIETESAEARALADSKVQLQEKNRVLMEESRLQNKSIQERVKAAAERKRIAAEERELNRLIAEEEKQLLKERELAEKEMLAAKEVADKEYQALWQQLLIEREVLEKEAAEQTRINAMITAQSYEEMTGANLILTDAQERLNLEYERTKVEAAAAAQITRENAIATQQTAAAAKEAAIAKEEEAIAQKQSTIATATNYTARQRLIAQSIQIKAEMAELSAQIKLNNEAFAAGRIEYDAFERKTVILTEQQALLKVELAQVNAQLKTMIPGAEKAGATMSKFTSIVERMGLRMIASLLIFQTIIELIRVIGEGIQQAADRVNVAQRTMSDIAEKSNNSFFQEAINLKVLKERFEDVTASMTTKKEIVQELNDKYSSQIGHINGINDAEKFFRDKSDDMVTALLLRAKAAGSLAVIQETYQKEIEYAADPSKALSGWDKFYTAVQGTISRTFGGMAAQIKTGVDASQDAVKSATNDILEERKVALQVLKDVQKEADAIDAKTGINTNEKGKKAKKEKDPKYKDATTAEIKAAKDLADAKLLLDKQEYEQEAANQKAIYENEKNSLAVRLAAFEDYTDAIKHLAYLETNAAIEAEQQKQKLLQAELQKANAGTLKLNAEQIKALETEIKASEIRINALRAKGVADANIITANGEKTIAGIVKSSTAELVKETEKRIANINRLAEDAMNNEESALSIRYKNGEINKEEYEREKLKIQQKYEKARLESAALELQTEIANAKAAGQDAKRLQELLDQINKLLDQLNVKAHEKAAVTADLMRQKSEDAIKEWAQTVTDIIDKVYQKKIQGLDNQLSAIDKNKQAEIDAINETALSSEEKQRRITAAEKTAQAQSEQIEKRKKAVQIQQAKFDKATSIANIIASTAEAVVKTLKSYPPPGNIALAAVVGAIGAAQLARAIATPIPQFAKGGTMKQSGLAIVGEEGVELGKTSSGKQFLTPSVPTLTYLEAGTQITNKKDTYKKLMAMAASGIGINAHTMQLIQSRQKSTEFIELKEVMRNELTSLRKAYQNAPIHHTTVTKEGFQHQVQEGSRTVKYLNDLYY